MEYNKKWMGADLNALAIQRALDQIQIGGQELPCTIAEVVSPGIVTVNFQVDSGATTLPPVTVPVAMNAYQRVPFKAGDPGLCAAASVVLGGVTGLGSGLPALWTRPANLAALVFVPLATTSLTTPDPAAYVLYDQTQAHSVQVSSSGVKIDGNITADPSHLAFYGGSKVAKPTVTGQCVSATTVAQLAVTVKSLLNALSAAGINLLTDSTT